MATIAEPRRVQLDTGRITAGAGAIALNAMVLMLLMVPIAMPPPIDRPEPEPTDFWLPPRPKPEVVPPLPVPVTRPKQEVKPDPRPVQPPPSQPSSETTDTPQPGDIVVPPGDTQVVEPPGDPIVPPDTGEPVQGAHLEYAAAPPPPYPREAVIEALTGTVMLQVLVDVDGKPIEVSVQRSSGHRVLDIAARRQVLSKWRFRPAMRNGQAVQAIGIVPVEFTLD